MLFNSLEFALFFPLVFILYWFVFNKTLKLQNFFVLIVSYVFYGWWSWKFLLLIAMTTLISYCSGLLIKQNEKNRKYCTRNSFNIIFNLIILGIFKFYNFFATNFADTMPSDSINLGDKSIPEFLKKWHLSLSTWFKDYLYIPLEGNHCSKEKHYRNILTVFLVSELWHEAN